jgi:hypothetical protein
MILFRQIIEVILSIDEKKKFVPHSKLYLAKISHQLNNLFAFVEQIANFQHPKNFYLIKHLLNLPIFKTS